MLALAVMAALLAAASADFDMSFASRPAQHMQTVAIGAAKNEGILAAGYDTVVEDEDDMGLHGMRISSSLLMKSAPSPSPHSFSSLNLAEHMDLEGDILAPAAHESDNLPWGMDEASAHVLAFTTSAQVDFTATQLDPFAFTIDMRTAVAKALNLHRGQVKVDNVRDGGRSILMDVAILLPSSSSRPTAEEVKAAFLARTPELLSHLSSQYGVSGGSSMLLGDSGPRQSHGAPSAMLEASAAGGGISKNLVAVCLLLLGVALL